jgi:hypothetical protein
MLQLAMLRCTLQTVVKRWRCEAGWAISQGKMKDTCITQPQLILEANRTSIFEPRNAPVVHLLPPYSAADNFDTVVGCPHQNFFAVVACSADLSLPSVRSW